MMLSKRMSIPTWSPNGGRRPVRFDWTPPGRQRQERWLLDLRLGNQSLPLASDLCLSGLSGRSRSSNLVLRTDCGPC